MALEEEDYRSAGTLYRESLSLRAELGLKWEVAVALECLARLAHKMGDSRRAVRLYAAAAAQRETLHSPEMAPNAGGNRRSLRRLAPPPTGRQWPG